MPSDKDNRKDLVAEIDRLRSRLREAEETLDAIRNGEVDAIVASGPQGDQVYTLTGADRAYRLLFETMNEGAAILGSDATVFFCNTRLSDLLNTPMEKIVGGSMFRFVPEPDLPAIKELIKNGLNEPQKAELSLRSSDGAIVPSQISTSPFSVEKSSSICMIVADMSERKELEHQREALIEVLESKNAELESFAYTVSHDLKAPLITIQSFASTIMDDLAAGNIEQSVEDLKRVQAAARGMNDLLHGLLELSRVGRIVNPPEPTPFKDVVTESLNGLQGLVDRSNARIAVAEDFPIAVIDKLRMVQIVQNLIENAIKFSGIHQPPHIEIGSFQDKGENVFYVKDHGEGIDSLYQEQVFDVFYQLDPSAPGVGLGLAVVKKVIEQHNGRVWVRANEGEPGTTFFFSLPQSRSTEGYRELTHG